MARQVVATIAILFALFAVFCIVQGSEGDQSPFYRNCIDKCIQANCTKGGKFSNSSNVHYSTLDTIIGWTCQDECRYTCMWPTVEAFRGRKWNVPQFHGKWPFVRVLCMQEVASVTFSILNFIVQLNEWRKFRKEVNPDYPFYWMWSFYVMICLNSWVWSIVFHARDTSFTEIMDYVSAFSVVTYFLFCFGARVGSHLFRGATVVHACLCIALYVFHATYLLFVKLDYGYNMIVNISVGGITSIIWFAWCVKKQKELPHAHYLMHFLLGLWATMLFEILDFEPIYWTFDAHAIWHCTTIPLPYLLFRFVKADCKYLHKEKEKNI